MLSRREFATLLSTALAASCSSRSANGRPPRILLCSAWQTVNIGDIAHTPGFLTLMERYLPEVETYLWPRDIGQGVEQKLIDRFPKLKLVMSESERQQAFEECDFFVHGSSATVSAISQINQWVEETSKGFGIYGITFDDHQSWILKPDTPEQLQTKISILNQAEFVFFRDSESIELAKSLGCQTEVTGFAPDAAFACDVRDDAKAEAFLSSKRSATAPIPLLHRQVSIRSLLADERQLPIRSRETASKRAIQGTGQCSVTTSSKTDS